MKYPSGRDRSAARVSVFARRLRRGVAMSVLLAPLFAPPPAGGQSVEFTPDERARILRMSPLPAPPPDPTNRVADDPRAAQLGQRLFFEQGLSANGKVSCATCHDPSKSFTDAKPLGEGIATLKRHTPQLWNVAHIRWLFWDGRADSLWAQALQPLEHPDEHGFSRLQLAHFLHDDPTLRTEYEKVFGPLPRLDDTARFPQAGRPVANDAQNPQNIAWAGMSDGDREAVNRTFSNAGKAIAAYERKLRSGWAPFDRFVEGLRENDPQKQSALSDSAQRGIRLFIGRGNCRLCHSGPNFTDGEFHDTRVAPLDGRPPTDAARYDGVRLLKENPFNAAGEFSDDRTGTAARLLEFTANSSENWGRFKTPSLRNVALTAPYMHQGQLATLDDVLHHYSTLEGALPPGHHRPETILVPLHLSGQETADLRAFLESLTDDALAPELTRPPPARP